MKYGISIFLLLGTLGCISISTPSKASAIHHELIPRVDQENGKVEIYFAEPTAVTKKMSAVVYIHGVQRNERPGAVNLANGGVLDLTAKMGYLAVAMSMPGYGGSWGEADFCGKGSQMALRSVLAYLRRRADVDPQRIAVSGISCGAIVGAMVADKDDVALMVLVSGVYDFQDMYKKWHSPDWPLEPQVMNYIDTVVAKDGGSESASKFRSALPNAKNFKMPILLVAGGKDRIVDWEQSRNLADALKSQGRSVELMLNPDGQHMIEYDEWANLVDKFMHKVLKN